jgi:DNA-binding NarL/FixJ family response regulator
MAVRCLLVDDSPTFLAASSNLLEGQGISIVGVASGPAEAHVAARRLEPDVTIVDIDLNGESGFDLAWELAAASDRARTSVILTSTRSESDFAELIAVTPALGFVTKNELSGDAVRDFLADRNHGRGCRHEALVYSSPRELAAGAVPFLRHGLERRENVLVVLRKQGRAVLEEALGDEADRIEFADAHSWYQSPEHALEQYTRYVGDRLERGASRVRVVAEVIWPQSAAANEVAGWKRYEARVSETMASVPVSFICTYDTEELPAQLVTDARRTHPVLRTATGPCASPHYVPQAVFVRSLDEEAELSVR